MTKIDWTKPIEAYHPDGRVVDVVKSKGWQEADQDGEYRVDGLPDSEYDPYFYKTGHGDGEWRIRNRQPAVSPELVERMVNLVREVAASIGEWGDQARAILAELEPADPDLELAREVVAEHGYSGDSKVQLALAAIKRARGETQ